jgi:hypothetical protein
MTVRRSRRPSIACCNASVSQERCYGPLFGVKSF